MTTTATSPTSSAASAVSSTAAATSPSSSSSTTATLTTNTQVPVIHKRKVKFSVQLSIQELLSVPYLNGVLFCKVRLCDGGYHVSYSSKKEVSNACVSWTDDAPIRFDAKLVQLVSSSPTGGGEPSSLIVGYEPCYLRISVRKEQRGGRSYQKLGYVDHNLCDFIDFRQQQSTTADAAATLLSAASNEVCVNRVLKEYESGSKNQTRLDNSYLKIRIKVTDTTATTSSSFTSATPTTTTPFPSSAHLLPHAASSSSFATTPIVATTTGANNHFSPTSAIHQSFRRLPKFFKSLKERTSSSQSGHLHNNNHHHQQSLSSSSPPLPATPKSSTSTETTTSLKATLSDPQLLANANSSNNNVNSEANAVLLAAALKASQSNASHIQQMMALRATATATTPLSYVPTISVDMNNTLTKNSTCSNNNNNNTSSNINTSPLKNGDQQHFTPSNHSRTSSNGSSALPHAATTTATTDSSLMATASSRAQHPSLTSASYSAIALQQLQPPLSINTGGVPCHNRTCSNGSIKSNTSYEFFTRARNKKFIEDIQSTSSISTATSAQLQPPLFQPLQPLAILSNHSPSSLGSSTASSSKPQQLSDFLAHETPPPAANMRIIETRFDANDVIAQIESELAARKQALTIDENNAS